MTSDTTPGTTGIDTVEAETDRIMRTGTVWLGAVLIAAAVLLGPAVAGGWRPADLPLPFDIVWWLGAIAAALGTALLIWAGCPVLAYALEDAYRQKVFGIRIGIVLSVAGMTLSGLAVLLAPVA